MKHETFREATIEEISAALGASDAIAERYQNGELTQHQSIQALLEIGYPSEHDAGNFLLHALHQEKLDELREQKGIIVD